MNKHQELIVRALLNMKGDDLTRARAAFSRYTPAQMDIEYGMSGKTPRQILAEYENREIEVDSAILWVKGQPA